jgi:1-deoxy-D-xylulose-5-phosphate reductoisomerase
MCGLQCRIGYLDIVRLIEMTCAKHREELVVKPSLEEILHYDGWAREYALQLVESGSFRSAVVV